MVETPIGFPEGHHVLDQIIVRARIDSLDRATHRAKLALELQFPHMREHPAGSASTTLGIYIEEQGAKDLLISLHRLSLDLGWKIVLPSHGGMAG
jgi:hypothetical protein